MEATYPKDGIFLFNDVFTDEECEYIIGVINKYAVKGREKHEPTKNVIADSVNIMELSEPGLKKRVCDLMFEKIMDMCKKFSEVYNIRMGGFESPTLRKIRGATKLHKDGILSREKMRNMSIILALNDNYQGGELCFPEHGRIIKLKKGQLVAFPPYWTHPHYTNELLNGTVRYTMNCWTHETAPNCSNLFY
jgi:hypothetical protein|tara:strand:- start:280 stop:855 length:576 start_codon:yes stop_codon:yes gene_type:complete